jgi:hypothetical protein
MQYGGFSFLLDGPALFPNGPSASSLIAVYNANGVVAYETNAESTASPNTIASISFNGGSSDSGSSGLSGGAIVRTKGSSSIQCSFQFRSIPRMKEQQHRDHR